MNLLSNAFKFTPDGGSILLSLWTEGDTYGFTVRDSGIGMSPEQLTRIFERFYKVDTFSKGSGLGLAIANEIMELVGGRIYLDDTYCGGCRFIVEWPMKDKP